MDDPLRQLPGYLLRRASTAMMARLHERLAPFDLRPAEASLLRLIGERAQLTQSEAGRIMGIQRANMAPLTARLEARGLISRLPMSGRAQALALTGAGRALLDQVQAAFAAQEDEIMARVPEPLRPHVRPILLAIWGPDAE
ncbi:MarR family winged helix-turn-helix transcriptional regulator [Sandarakinorhabdus oryzae]|uniref:MarR family winged helix-turn-helix transcriptional regulator n=1 Tax=Sandarakinorhabdus oryzae TaxID=2675220 RepID=UPI0018CBF7C5|nr:MarR family transcriptional regulator [Sandarakinorhabdus oryzae]